RTQLARELIYKLDNAQSNPSNLHVVYLRNAQAGKLAQALRGLLTGESDSGEGQGDPTRAMLSGGGSNSSSQNNQNSSQANGITQGSTPTSATRGSALG